MTRLLICYSPQPNEARRAIIESTFKVSPTREQYFYPGGSIERSPLTEQVVVIDAGNWSDIDALALYRELLKKCENATILWSIWSNTNPPYLERFRSKRVRYINMSSVSKPIEHLYRESQRLLEVLHT